MKMAENQRMLAAVELEKIRLERSKYELARVNRIEEILSRCNHQQVSLIRDILVPEEFQNDRVKCAPRGHQVDHQIFSYDIDDI